MSKKRNRHNYPKDFKNDAIKLAIEQGYTCTEVGRRLGINQTNVSRWVRQYRNAEEEPTQGARSELESENRRLRKENRRLLMEREILKKAAAFFAKESN